MSLELKPNSSYWYGRVTVNGKRVLISLEVPVQGRRPQSLREEGDPPFERSRAIAQAKLEPVERELRERGNSIREISVLPREARGLLLKRAELVRNILKKNLEAENVKSDLEPLVDLILTFNTGLCLEANISIEGAETKIRQFVRILQKD